MKLLLCISIVLSALYIPQLFLNMFYDIEWCKSSLPLSFMVLLTSSMIQRCPHLYLEACNTAYNSKAVFKYSLESSKNVAVMSPNVAVMVMKLSCRTSYECLCLCRLQKSPDWTCIITVLKVASWCYPADSWCQKLSVVRVRAQPR